MKYSRKLTSIRNEDLRIFQPFWNVSSNGFVKDEAFVEV